MAGDELAVVVEELQSSSIFNRYVSSASNKRKQYHSWSDLPLDLLGLIFLGLRSRDRSVMRFVCKSWYLFNPISWVPPPCGLFSVCSKFPCLMIPQKQDNVFKLFHPICNESHTVDFPELIDAKVLFSNFGWLLVYSCDKKLFFFNPSSRDKLGVPSYLSTFSPALLPVTPPPTLVSATFTSPPTCSDCCIFGIYWTDTIIGCATLQFGQGHQYWAYVSAKNYFPNNIMLGCSPIIRKKYIYCMDTSGSIVVPYRKFMDCWYDVCPVYDSIKYVSPLGQEVKQCYMLRVEEKTRDIGDIQDYQQIRIHSNFLGYYNEHYDGYRPYHFKFLAYEGPKEKINDLYIEFLVVFVLADTNQDGRLSVQVMRLEYHITRIRYAWKPVDNLGDKCLYVGDNGSFLVNTSHGHGMANTIYFNSLDGGEGIVSYSLDTGDFVKYSGELGQRGTWITPTPIL